MFIGLNMVLLGLRVVPSNMALVGNYIRPPPPQFISQVKSLTVDISFNGGLKLAVKPVILCSAALLVPEGNLSLVALLLNPRQMHDSRLTFHLMGLLSCRPSLLSSSSRITSSLWIWAVLVNAISSTDKSTLASWAAKPRKFSFIRNQNFKDGCFILLFALLF